MDTCMKCYLDVDVVEIIFNMYNMYIKLPWTNKNIFNFITFFLQFKINVHLFFCLHIKIINILGISQVFFCSFKKKFVFYLFYGNFLFVKAFSALRMFF